MLQSFLSKVKPSLIRTRDNLNTDEAISVSGFALGFITQSNQKDLLEKPLTTIFFGTIFGIITSFGASCVGAIIHPKFRCVIPVAVTASCAYHIMNPDKVPRVSNFEISVDKKIE
jgi:hypothetical protein